MKKRKKKQPKRQPKRQLDCYGLVNSRIGKISFLKTAFGKPLEDWMGKW